MFRKIAYIEVEVTNEWDKILNQDLLMELANQGFVKTVHVSTEQPSKGKPLLSRNKLVWTITVILVNGSTHKLVSTRGTPREWASLDRLYGWLKTIGLGNFHVIHTGDKQ